MKNVLLIATMLFCVSLVNAQEDLGEDVTPYNYVFDNLTDGDLYPFSDAVSGWWPAKTWPTMTGDGQFEGFLGVNNGSEAVRNEVYRAGTSIINLGEEIGNVFCIRGIECPDDILTDAPKCDESKGNWNCDALMYSFTASANPNDPKPNVFKIVMNVKAPTTHQPGWGILENNTRYYEHTTGDLKLSAPIGKLTIGDFGKEDEWLEIIVKYNHGTEPAADGTITTNKPGAFILNFAPSTLKGCAFLIKELSFYKDPTFTEKEGVVTKKLVTFGSTGTKAERENNSVTYSAKDGIVRLENLIPGDKVTVTSLSGIVVKDFFAKNTIETLPLENGYYTVSVKGQNFKILNKK